MTGGDESGTKIHEGLSRLLEKAGEVRRLSSNRPFLLHEPNRVWLVREGGIDVFFVETWNREPVSGRRFVFSVGPGECIFGLDTVAESSSFGFLAVPSPGASAIELEKSRLLEIMTSSGNQNALVRLIDRWSHCLTRGIVPPYTPRELKEVPVGECFNAGHGDFIRPRHDILWFKHIHGSSCYLSNTNLLLLDRDPFIPLFRDIWIETEAEQNTFIASTTAELLNEPGKIEESLAALARMVLECLMLYRLEGFEHELKKAQERVAAAGRQMKSIRRELASIVKGQIQPPEAEVESEDPLFAACAIVGASLGIPMQPPVDHPGRTHPRDPLEEIARASRIRIRRVSLSGPWWRRDGGPLLGFTLEDERPVALIPSSPMRYVRIDPEGKSRRDVEEDLASTISPVAYTFYRPLPERSLSLKGLLLFAFRDCRQDGLMILLTSLLGALLGFVAPLVAGVLIDSAVPSTSRSQLCQLTLAMLVAAFAGIMFKLANGYALLRIESRASHSLQCALWDRLLSLPVLFFRRYSVGDLASRVYGIQQICQILSQATVSILLSSVFSIFTMALLFYYSKTLALASLGLMALFSVATLAMSRYSIARQKQIQNLSGKISGHVLQFITGISKLRTAGAELRAYGFWVKLFSARRRLVFRVGSINRYFLVFNTVFGSACTLIIYITLAATFDLKAGESQLGAMREGARFSVGDLMAFSAAFGLFVTAVSQFGGMLAQILQVVPLYERSQPILEAIPEVVLGKANPGEIRGEIEVNSVCFRYSTDGPDTLKNVSLRADPGEFIAVVGPSGSGKSTLFRLLLGFEKPLSGAVYFDGKDLADLNISLVRRQFGVVLQNDRIPSGSILENIAGASPLPLENAWEAARMAGLEDDIRAMPMGMHTYVSEGAGMVSGGQRQRLMIARALVHKPKVILFDEATSALDNPTQKIVSESLEALDATRIVIAHRLSTILNADRIYVLAGGEIVEQGTCEYLMKKDGVFADLARRQLI